MIFPWGLQICPNHCVPKARKTYKEKVTLHLPCFSSFLEHLLLVVARGRFGVRAHMGSCLLLPFSYFLLRIVQFF